MNDDETAKSLFQDALKFLDVRDYAQAETRLRAVLALKPSSVPTLANLAYALLSQGKAEEARRSAEQILLIDNRDVEGRVLLAGCLVKERRFAEALAAYDEIVAMAPRSPDLHNDRGFVLNEMKQHQDALASFDKAIALAPNLAAAQLNRGATLGHLGRYDEAVTAYAAVLNRSPGLAAAHLGIGNALFRLKRNEQALAAYDRALAIDFNLGDAWLGRGNVRAALKRYNDALSDFSCALRLRPDFTNAWIGQGNVLTELQRYDEALAAFDRALSIDADLAGAWIGRGNVHYDRLQYDDAVAAYDKALAVDPALARAWLGRAGSLFDLKRLEEAARSYDRAHALDPGLADVEGHRLHSRMHLCDWRDFASDRAHLLQGIRSGKPVAAPLVVLGLSSSAADQLQCARRYAADRPRLFSEPVWRGERYQHDKIRVAYLSADFRGHPVSLLMAGVFERHDRGRFETFAISFGPDDTSPMRTRLKGAFNRFVDAGRQSSADVTRLLRELEIDIAVDLMGHTVGARPEILAARAVPIQAGYLGYPGTTGMSSIDYILADDYVIPPEHAQHYSEKVVYLPGCFQANDSTRRLDKSLSRAAAGLPDRGFVFCVFNNNYKITPPIFDVWMSLLRDVEGSMLWLLAPNASTERNLRAEAAVRGIDASRLVLAPRVDYETYLARYKLADLFLDTLPFNAGTTASDALWTGLPLVTCSGEAFASRMAGSLLMALKMPELITETLDDYKALALRIAREPALLADLKARLSHNAATSSLYDPTEITGHIETAYTTMWQRTQRGEPPTSFAV